MSELRGALVTTYWDDARAEQDLAVRRVAGAVACFAELDVLVPGRDKTTEEPYAGVRLIRYTAPPPDHDHRSALNDALFGPSTFLGAGACLCHQEAMGASARELPARVQWALLAAEGGDSPELTRLLRAGDYDFTIFAGCSAATYLGMTTIPSDKPTAFLPLTTSRPVERLPLVDELYERTDVILTFTNGEEATTRLRVPNAASKVVNVGFVARVHELARGNDPHGYAAADRVAIVADWRDNRFFEALEPWLALTSAQFPEVELRPLGPGAGSLPFPYATGLSEGTLDTWRWMARSLAVLDPLDHQLIGRYSLEALQYGVPVLVAEHGGASREHAERGRGGLWFRAYPDLAASIELLRADQTLRQELASHGQAYAQETYGDTKRFITAVADAVRPITY